MDPTTSPTPTAGVPGNGRVARDEVDQARAIARAVDRNARKTTELNEQVRRLGEDVARLVALVTTPPLFPAPAEPREHPPAGDLISPAGPGGPDEVEPEGSPGQPVVWSWLLMSDPETAVTVMADLVRWLDQVYLRFPGAELGACWLWHPHVIEELLWLRSAHAEGYDPEAGSWLRVGDWHDRQRPGVVRRIKESLGKCDLSLHAPGRPHGHAPAVAPLVAHAAQVAQQWATTSTRPAPSVEQLAEAADYGQALHRRAR
jgi:hypothetical protein